MELYHKDEERNQELGKGKGSEYNECETAWQIADAQEKQNERDGDDYNIPWQELYAEKNTQNKSNYIKVACCLNQYGGIGWV